MSLLSAFLLVSASLVVAFNAVKASHAHNAQARSPKQYTMLDHYSAEDFMNET